MKKYNPLILKESITNANDLASMLQKEILHIFPHSGVIAKFSANLYPSITVWFMLAKDRSETSNGIVQNDIAYQTLSIHGRGSEIDKEGTLPNVLTIENNSNAFTVKPTVAYMAYSHITVPFRKTSGSPEKIIEYTKKYFMLFKKMLQDHRSDIPEDHLKLIGKKF